METKNATHQYKKKPVFASVCEAIQVRFSALFVGGRGKEGGRLTWIASLRSQWRVAGFTLVELIVVITILVILGTIAFVSLGGYAGSARDSSRVSDLSLVSKSLDIGYAKTGSYPSPTGAVGVTYSGAVAWYQGTVGDSVILALGGVGSKISKKPTDPLLSTEYTYSLAAETREYSLATNYEGSSVAALTPTISPREREQRLSVIAIPQTGEANQINQSFSVFSNTEDSSWIASSLRSSQWRDGIVSEAFAESWNPTIVYVKGTYNGVVVKVSTGSKVNLLAVPNILVSSGITALTGSSVGFLVHGSSNSGGLVFVPKLVYSSGALPNNDTDRIAFASGVVSAYSGTSLASNGNITQFISAAGSTGALASIGGNFVGASLGGGASNAVVSRGGIIPPAAPTAATHTGSSNSITWKWNAVSWADGYKWSTGSVYAGAIDTGTGLSYVQSGLSANTSYTGYVWAYNAGGNSSVWLLNMTTSVAPPTWLLLHGDGNFTDFSTSPKTVTLNGNTTTSTAQSVFGGSSLSFDGTNDYIDSSSNDYVFGTGDFTIDFWFYYTGSPAAMALLSIWWYQSGVEIRYEGGGLYVWVRSNAGGGSRSTWVAQTINTWSHYAIVRSGNTYNLYKDGTRIWTDSYTWLNFPANNLRIGKVIEGGQNDLSGYLDEIRISKGVAQWTWTTLPIPTAPY